MRVALTDSQLDSTRCRSFLEYTTVKLALPGLDA